MADLIERLRRLIDDRCGGGPSGHNYDPELLDVLTEAAAALRAVREAPVAIMDTREFLSLCAPTEDDFPALYALQGQRVRIVKEGE